ncbi:hypothetical protein DP42_4975 [Burkholderia pseudomallei]|nr:hypothetical protein DP42_4975 [Burkholderia pseudomallei]
MRIANPYQREDWYARIRLYANEATTRHVPAFFDRLTPVKQCAFRPASDDPSHRIPPHNR